MLYISPLDDEDAECHSQISQLLAELEDPDDMSPLSFFAHAPIPQVLIDNCYKIGDDVEKENYKATGYSFLHEYTKKEWGTSFDACDVTFTQASNGDPCFEFRTLEGVCLPWLEKVSELFPNLYFDMDCTNELDLFDSYTVSYNNGVQIDFETHKKTNKKKTK